MAGWTEENCELRKAILKHGKTNGDIIGIQETHLSNNTENQPTLEGYRWFGHCRSVRHVKAKRTHGAIGVFIKEALFQTYAISVLDNSFDGIMCLLFQVKISEYCFTVYCCYLPPENSPYGRDSTAFFTHLLSLIYLHSYVDCSFVFGDLNSRIGDKQDAIMVVDDVPRRETIDSVQNKHGESFLDFLIEARMFITNGRVNGRDEFTSVSARGKSVVDYFAVPHENIGNCISCDVQPVSAIIESCGLEPMVAERSKAPDHSLVSLKFKLNKSYVSEQNDTSAINGAASKRYRYNTMSPEFLRSSTWLAILDLLIFRLESIDPLQSQVDVFYNEMLSKIFTEMDSHIQYSEASKRSKKHYKNHKPFWTNELTTAWRDMSNAEKEYIKCNHRNPEKRYRREQFLIKRKYFDRLLRRT